VAFRHWKCPFLIAVLATLSMSCGSSQPARTVPPSNPADLSTAMPSATSVASAGVTATIVPSATRAPTPDATQHAAPTIEPDLGGFIRDFFLAVRTGDDAKARHYLAPGLYATATSLRDTLGLPPSTSVNGGTFTIDSHLIERERDRLTVETTIQSGERTIRKRLTLERNADYWQITAIQPIP